MQQRGSFLFSIWGKFNDEKRTQGNKNEIVFILLGADLKPT
jgi:hypothetical protein